MLATIWVFVGLAMVLVPVWVGLTRWSVILNGHPATLVVTIACGLAGIVALAWAIATLLLGERFDTELASGEPKRTEPERRRRARWRLGLAVPALLVCLLTTSLLAWSRPYPASEVALSAMRSANEVRVADRLTWFELQSTRKDRAGRTVKATTGLIFYPGARVDSRAYAHLLRPLASAGYLVVVVKEPFGLGLINSNAAERVLEVHPEITRWAVGGHSLGGVAASSFADSHAPRVQALVLYAAYPAGKLSRTDLKVLSVSGSADGLATPDKVAASRPDLPARAQFVVVKGGVHAFFGDYGPQQGDGTPRVSRAAAQSQIVRATKTLLASLTPPAKK